jgi:hypothetical protein
MGKRHAFPQEYPSLVAYVAELLALSRKEAGVVVRLAMVELQFCAEAAEVGGMSLPQLGVIADLMEDIEELTTPEERLETEVYLAESAAAVDARALKGLANKIRAMVGFEGPEPKDDPDKTGNRLRTGFLKGGVLKFNGQLCAEDGARLVGLLGPLAAPKDGPEGKDPQDQEERDGDALAEIVGLAAKCNEHTQGGGDAAVNVTVGLAELQDVTSGSVLVPNLGNLSAEAVRLLACDARVIPVVLGGKGEVLDVGRSYRLATTAQRRALEVRDKGCLFPGCGRGVKWCTPHHIRHWVHGGPTDLGNMALLCAHHHRKVHHSQWEIQMIDGKPWFIPPLWLDPQRTPMQNL